MNNAHEARLARARIALEGLSTGDAFGMFCEKGYLPAYQQTGTFPVSPLRWTDDTNMALSIYACLKEQGAIDQERLAQHFAQHFDHGRGYGMGARQVLIRILAGEDWHSAGQQVFSEGSFGNGGAMRIAPLGAYFADDLTLCVEQAKLSCEVTHAHPEGIAGGIAVAVAAAQATRLRGDAKPTRVALLDLVLPYVPESEVRQRLLRARDLPAGISRDEAAAVLGTGSLITAQDTVPFCLWCAGEYLDDYQQAVLQAVSIRGDGDTNGAIVGGIIACYTGIEAIPQLWIERREPLPEWAVGA
jgi:ADP-ribosylglycohydrolase